MSLNEQTGNGNEISTNNDRTAKLQPTDEKFRKGVGEDGTAGGGRRPKCHYRGRLDWSLLLYMVVTC